MGKGHYGGARDPTENTTRKVLGVLIRERDSPYIYSATGRQKQGSNDDWQKSSNTINR